MLLPVGRSLTASQIWNHVGAGAAPDKLIDTIIPRKASAISNRWPRSRLAHTNYAGLGIRNRLRLPALSGRSRSWRTAKAKSAVGESLLTHSATSVHERVCSKESCRLVLALSGSLRSFSPCVVPPRRESASTEVTKYNAPVIQVFSCGQIAGRMLSFTPVALRLTAC